MYTDLQIGGTTFTHNVIRFLLMLFSLTAQHTRGEHFSGGPV